MALTSSPRNRHSFRALLLLVLALVGASGAQAPVTGTVQMLEEPRVALVIGNGQYAEHPVTTATADALAMARALKAARFQVIQRLDADKRQMSDAIGVFRQRLRRGGVGLIYYAGHAIQVDGRNYLMPLGSDVDSETAAAFEAVDLGALVDMMAAADTRVNIVIVDANRAHSLAARLPTAAPGLARLESAGGVLVAFAATPGTVVADVPVGGNSLYTRMLLDSMAAPGRSLPEVFRSARSLVASVTPDQVPWFSSSSSEEFAFLLAAPGSEDEDAWLAAGENEKGRSRKWLWLLLGLGVAGSVAIAGSDGDPGPSTGGVEIEVVVP